MGVTAETIAGRLPGIRSSAIKKPISLRSSGSRILLDPDGSLRSFDSLPERRAVFGAERLWVFKVQSGVVIQAGRPDWAVRTTPQSAQFAGRVFDNIEVVQSVEFLGGSSTGYLRRVKVRNAGTYAIALRLIDAFDPTAAQFQVPLGRWGSLGVNAFNRVSHVAMDEVSDPPSARVIGAMPSPKSFYMTTDRTKALDLAGAGEVPEQTAGMSGQVIVLSVHDLDLAPSETKEVVFASIYSPAKLEDALSEFGRLQPGERPVRRRGPFFSSSSQAVNEAVGWAFATVGEAPYTADGLDRWETFRALALSDPDAAKALLRTAKDLALKEGSMPHSLSPGRTGFLETALFLRGASEFLVLCGDKKLSRAMYPLLRRAANALLAGSKDQVIVGASDLPQGWRRLIGRGYPTGEIPEVSLAVAAGLHGAADVAKQLSKADDAGRFRGKSDLIADRVRKKLIDERGLLGLCLDSVGRLRNDDTIDAAVAAYRHPFLRSAEQAVAHRLIEKDFETPFGARTVPTSNRIYFNPAYGSGQLGGYWTRAALAHVLLCYRVGMSGTGSLEMEKIAKLVTEEIVKLGSAPGEFPQWVDVEAGEAHGDESDTVAAARMVEAVIAGELGLNTSPKGVVISPPEASSLSWVLLADLWAGEAFSAFVGRGAGRVHSFVAGSRASASVGLNHAKAEPIEGAPRGLRAISFHTPGQVICVGNPTGVPVRGSLQFAPRAAELSKRLSTPLEEFDPAKGSWEKVGSVRVLTSMAFDVSVGPGDWKAFRVSTA